MLLFVFAHATGCWGLPHRGFSSDCVLRVYPTPVLNEHCLLAFVPLALLRRHLVTVIGTNTTNYPAPYEVSCLTLRIFLPFGLL